MLYTGPLRTRALFLGIALAIVSCTNQNSNPSQFELNTPNPYTDNFYNDFGNMADQFNNGQATQNPLGSTFQSGSSPNGGLAPQDRTALNNVFAKLEGINPQKEVDLPPELLAALTQIMEQQAQGNTSPELLQAKMQIGVKVLAHCSAQIAQYAPQPGETLVGDWAGKGCHNIDFSVTGHFASSFTKQSRPTRMDTLNQGFAGVLPLGRATFILEGNQEGLRGIIAPAPNGVGTLQAGRWAGVFGDVPMAAEGIITKQGRGGCKTDVTLETPRNLIPQKYVEGMKRAGQCFGQALLIMSPIVDELFKDLDPEVVQLLWARMLGLQ